MFVRKTLVLFASAMLIPFAGAGAGVIDVADEQAGAIAIIESGFATSDELIAHRQPRWNRWNNRWNRWRRKRPPVYVPSPPASKHSPRRNPRPWRWWWSKWKNG